MSDNISAEDVSGIIAAAVADAVVAAESHTNKPLGSRTIGARTIKRLRRRVEDIFREKGPRDVRRSYRMTEESFWVLSEIIESQMPRKKQRKRGKTPNGDIPNDLRLSMMLRYAAGGDPNDIASSHGVGSTEVY